MRIRRSWFIIHFEMVFLFEIFLNTVSEQVWEQGLNCFQVKKLHKQISCFYSWFWASVSGIFRINILLAMQSKEFYLENSIKRSFPTLYWKRFYLYLILKMMLFTILLSSRIIFRYIVSIFLGTQSKDIILILFRRKIYFAKDLP